MNLQKETIDLKWLFVWFTLNIKSVATFGVCSKILLVPKISLVISRAVALVFKWKYFGG